MINLESSGNLLWIFFIYVFLSQIMKLFHGNQPVLALTFGNRSWNSFSVQFNSHGITCEETKFQSLSNLIDTG